MPLVPGEAPESLRRGRIGTALRAMAEDLVTERRRVLNLRRENQQLRAELDAIRRDGYAVTDRAGHVHGAPQLDCGRRQGDVCPSCGRPLSDLEGDGGRG